MNEEYASMDLQKAPMTPATDKAVTSESVHSSCCGNRQAWVSRACLCLALVGAIASVYLLFGVIQLNSIWMLRAGLAATTTILAYALLSGMVVRWMQPAKRFAQLLKEVHGGDAPIEELSSVGGGMQAIAAESKNILQELRQYKQQISQLDLEFRHKIANRTDALERLVGSLRNQANRDPLTGLYNRRMLDQLLPQLVRQCIADRTSLALQMIDVDYFKDLNDTLGHPAGDEMLRSLGQIIRSTIRATDFAFRYGGDEFVILMPGCGAEPASRIAERLDSLTAAMTSTYRLPRRPKLSIGISTLADLPDATAETLIERADALLYEKKQSKKDKSRAVPVVAATASV